VTMNCGLSTVVLRVKAIIRKGNAINRRKLTKPKARPLSTCMGLLTPAEDLYLASNYNKNLGYKQH
jgi:hypothetical protein